MTKILISGDFCPIGRTDELLKNERYTELFNGFNKITEGVDYSVVNFECPFTTSTQPMKKSGPNLKTENPNAFKALKYAGFDVLTLANNHIQDYGGQGVLDTTHAAKEHNFDIVGAGKNRSEAQKPLIKTINNVKIGFINIAENEFCAATDHIPGAYTFNFIDNLKTIQKLREEVDKIILIYHGGREHYQLPTPGQRKRLRFFVESGVDAIVAHHTHCVSGYEYYQEKPIVYSLGNFIFDYKKKYQKGLWTEGMSVTLTLQNKESAFTVKFLPHLQGRAADSTLQLLQNEKKSKFIQKIEDLSAIITDDKRFKNNWNTYIKSQEGFYLSSIYIKNFYLRALFIKGIIPIALLKTKHSNILLNLFRCETHQEISREILDQ